jgi:NAD(P)-dependent dehydrogenase (short-subunit alcohol dehydrogenase family)
MPASSGAAGAGEADVVNRLFDVDGKVALVTGGSAGIGAMAARGLVEAGARVYVVSRKERACEEMVAELSGVGDAVALPADLSTLGGVTSLVAALREREPALHVLVNNAGVNWVAPLDEYPEAGWDKVLNLNVKAVFHLTQRLVPLLEAAARPGDPARVINVGSIDGERVSSYENYAYAASKAAVHHLTRVLAQRLGRSNITVNAIAPGPFPSRMSEATLAQTGAALRAACPLGRLGEPDDVSGALIYFAARASSYVTGQVLGLDGGFSSTAW